MKPLLTGHLGTEGKHCPSSRNLNSIDPRTPSHAMTHNIYLILKITGKVFDEHPLGWENIDVSGHRPVFRSGVQSHCFLYFERLTVH